MGKVREVIVRDGRFIIIFVGWLRKERVSITGYSFFFFEEYFVLQYSFIFSLDICVLVDGKMESRIYL